MNHPSAQDRTTSHASELTRRLSLLAACDGLTRRDSLLYALDQAVAGLRGLAGMLHVPDQGRLRLVASRGLPPESLRTWEGMDTLECGGAPARALGGGALVRLTVQADPSCPLAGALGAGAADAPPLTLLSVPLREAGVPTGVLSVVTTIAEPTAAEQAFLSSLAEWTSRGSAASAADRRAGPAGGVAGDGWPADDGFQRAETEEPTGAPDAGPRVPAERTAARRTARIAELTTALSDAVTAHDVAQVVGDRVLPLFGAQGLVVEVFESGRRQVVGARGYSQEFLDSVVRTPQAAHSPFRDVLCSRLPIILDSPEAYLSLYPQMIGRLTASRKQAWIFLPLIASGESIGSCVITFDEPYRPSRDERTLLTALSGLIGQALARARLYDAEHARAQELQRSLLPRALPDVTAVTAAARYVPASTGTEVGGDWYDVIPLSSGRVALVIGDVMGHGLSEAVTMGRMRTAVRTLAHLELPPDEVLAHLNELVSGLGEDFYATCLYAVYDSTTGVCSVARAGHPPAAVALPDGTVSAAGAMPDPPLGAAELPFTTVERELPDHSLLALCTDGLLESAGRDVDEGLTDVGRVLARHRAWDVESLCDACMRTLLPDQHTITDDAALLVARVHRMRPENIASWPLAEEPQSARLARDNVRDQLAKWDLTELTMTTELLVSELVGNVVRHARGPMRMRLLRDRTLICEVNDGSEATPRIRRAAESDEGGRGLQLVAALSHSWGTRYTEDGKCIWAEQQLPNPS
ncbi:ATP-binding SpoIIE family protein phosphatase [Streptomyces sp. NBC_01361]|uniref:ATP-binding SpoIIE family protein phosphatase n=1 Tax=Streptomyces sp. NBC_01361 TaxID=2903838 RepID=UPI002E32EA43|nr:SpoIIE family protein phosphatase [Streptomyces sp. NBC_01361]